MGDFDSQLDTSCALSQNRHSAFKDLMHSHHDLPEVAWNTLAFIGSCSPLEGKEAERWVSAFQQFQWVSVTEGDVTLIDAGRRALNLGAPEGQSQVPHDRPQPPRSPIKRGAHTQA